MGDLLKLGGYGGVEFGDVVAVDVAPEGGNGIDIAAALGVDEEFVVAAFDDEDVFVFAPGLHGGEGVPEVLAVEGDEVAGGGLHERYNEEAR